MIQKAQIQGQSHLKDSSHKGVELGSVEVIYVSPDALLHLALPCHFQSRIVLNVHDISERSRVRAFITTDTYRKPFVGSPSTPSHVVLHNLGRLNPRTLTKLLLSQEAHGP